MEKMSKHKEQEKILDFLRSQGVNANSVLVDNDTEVNVSISWGDWKHDHIRTKLLMDSIGYMLVRETLTEEDGSDCYSAVHKYRRRG